MLLRSSTAIAGLLAIHATILVAEVRAQSLSPQRSASSVVAASRSPVPALSPVEPVIPTSSSHLPPTEPSATAPSTTRHAPVPAASACAAYPAAAADSSRAAYAESRFARSCAAESAPAAATPIPSPAATASQVTQSASAASEDHQAPSPVAAPALSSMGIVMNPAPAAAGITSDGANPTEPSDELALSDADPEQADAPNTVTSRFARRAARLQQQAVQAPQEPAADDQQPAAEQSVLASSTSNAAGSSFAHRSVAQDEPPEATPAAVPTPEVAGVQSNGTSPNRASVGLQVLPPSDQSLPATMAMIPSTGGPSAASLALGLAVLGGIGLWLRRLGARRS